jgi:hypothetical protein
MRIDNKTQLIKLNGRYADRLIFVQVSLIVLNLPCSVDESVVLPSNDSAILCNIGIDALVFISIMNASQLSSVAGK